MKQNITYREFQESDRPALEAIIRETWHYDAFCSPKTARRLARVYLCSCLANQTFTQVALAEGRPVGIIMSKNSRIHRCPARVRLNMAAAILALYSTREGRTVSGIFQCVQEIDARLLAQCQKNYPGELALFAVSRCMRKSGIGRALFEKHLAYLHSRNIREFFLFTDTSCNYLFYEHRGMVRRAEEEHTFSASGIQEKMRFFIYDFQQGAPA